MINSKIQEKAIEYLNAKPLKMSNGGISHPFAGIIEYYVETGKLKDRIDYLTEVLRNCDTEQILLLIDKNYILDFVNDIHEFLTVEEYSKIIMDEYTVANTGLYDMDEVLDMFYGTDIYSMMNKEEAEIYNSLPDQIIIYRGFGIEDDDDTDFLYRPSWTLKKDVAELFSKRAERNPALTGVVFQAKVNKNDIFAFTNCREEYEVIINPCILDNFQKCR